MNINKQKAFTLIELLVSIAIIAILTAIVTSNFASSRSKARDAKRISDINAVSVAIELFFERCGQYPKVSNGMPNINDGCIVAGGVNGLGLSDFISAIPTAPTPGSSYSYVVNNTSVPTDYVLKATLENNNSVLIDSPKTNFSTFLPSPGIDCSTTYAYCVQPK